MLVRHHQFMTEKSRADIERAADLFFPALGYRRRDAAPTGAEEPIVYWRGRRLASLWAPSLRRCRGSVSIDASESPERACGVMIRHRVEVLGRLVVAEDGNLLDTESRCFQRFLERGDPDTAELLDAATRRGRLATAWKVAAVLASGAVVYVTALLLAARRP